MRDLPAAAARSAALMVAARLLNLALGLLTIPVLIRYLGGDGFAAWAILLAVAAGFSLLELGMSPTVVRFLAVPARDQSWGEGRRLIGRVWVLLGASFGAGVVLTWWMAARLAGWVSLPDTTLFTAAQAVQWVFLAVTARAFLQSGTLSLFAARRFGAVFTVSLLQPVCSNVAAMLAAWQFQRLDIALIAYWSAQLSVLAATFFVTRRQSMPSIGRDTFDLVRLRELAFYGVTNQMEGWAQFVNFQFDKFLVAGLVGLWGVAPYEVANRAVAALRSIPASGVETFLPTAMVHQRSKEALRERYLSTTRMVAYGVVAFMLVPLAMSPIFLYAWTGEMGYLGRWVFVALMVGAAAGVLALPAATLAQAQGKPGLQSRAAILSMLVNVPLSLLLVLQWELVGAAIGTGIAMFVGAMQLIRLVHRDMGWSLRSTLRMLLSFWPLVLVCVCWGAASYALFSGWLATLDPAVRFSRVTRSYPGLAAITAYAMCLACVLWVEFRRGAFSPVERAYLLGKLKFR